MGTIANFTVEPNQEPVRRCWGHITEDLGPNPRRPQAEAVMTEIVDASEEVKDNWNEDDNNVFAASEVENAHDVNFEGTDDGV